jgi:glycosyltransferase involved in cell wall biosynthesis
MPVFSILLPTNKSQAFAQDSISSCLSNSFLDFELLIGVQDWKSWNSSLIKQQWILDDPRIKIIDSAKTSNLPSNLNHLISHASCDYAVRHDDDDLMHPLRLRSLFDNIDIVDRAVVAGQSYRVIDDFKQLISPVISPSPHDFRNRCRLLTGPCFAHPAITLNLPRLNQVYDESFDYAQDYKLYVDNFHSGDFLGIAGMATYYSEPKKSPSEFYVKKRVKQLELHDACMLKLWTSLIGSESISPSVVTMFRKAYITSEDDELIGASEINSPVRAADLSHYYLQAQESIARMAKARGSNVGLYN